jgi:hypothetical protein
MLAEDAIMTMPPWFCWLDGRYTAVCLTMLTLDLGGRISELTVFVLPELCAVWGYAPTLE